MWTFSFIQTLIKLKTCPITENYLDKDSILNVGTLTSAVQGDHFKANEM